MSSKAMVLGLLTLSLVSCKASGIMGVLPEAQTPEGIQFVTHDTLFATGDTVVLILTNATARPIGYNMCFGALEVWNGSTWQKTAKMPAPYACLFVRWGLRPGQTAQYRQAIYPFIAKGTYRFRDTIVWTDSNEESEVISNGFRVR